MNKAEYLVSLAWCSAFHHHKKVCAYCKVHHDGIIGQLLDSKSIKSRIMECNPKSVARLFRDGWLRISRMERISFNIKSGKYANGARNKQ